MRRTLFILITRMDERKYLIDDKELLDAILGEKIMISND